MNHQWIDLGRRIAMWTLFASFPCLAQAPATELKIDVSNLVLYNYDTFDTTQFGTNPSRTSVPMKTYNFHITIGDITAVGAAPAKGTLLCRSVPMFVVRPNPTAGAQAIGDISRNMMDDCAVEILANDGTAVETVFFGGLFGGSPPPGAPSSSTMSNLIITGGTGALLGVRGQAGHVQFSPRVASVTEDPANRRANGGGAASIVLQLLPMFRPEVVSTPGGPAVVHSSDFSLVTAAKPAKAGEILALFATGLGPTNPSVPFGQPFPAGSSQPITAPAALAVNGSPAEILYAGSYPGAVNGYQVNFRVPAGTPSGTATLRLTVGFIAGSTVTIPMQ